MTLLQKNQNLNAKAQRGKDAMFLWFFPRKNLKKRLISIETEQGFPKNLCDLASWRLGVKKTYFLQEIY